MLTATAYILTCCRPNPNTTFCYHIEPPKLIDFSLYQQKTSSKDFPECSNHEKLSDHCLKNFNSCTDPRSWGHDQEQLRKHFLDVVSKRVPLCGVGTSKLGSVPNLELFVSDSDSPVEVGNKTAALNDPDKDNVSSGQHDHDSDDSVDLSPIKECLEYQNKEENLLRDVLLLDKGSETEDVALLSDELIDQLSLTITNLTYSFDQYTSKSKICNKTLIDSLIFEQNKQKQLGDNVSKLKNENYCLKARIEYLQKVINNQKETFSQELLEENDKRSVYERTIRELKQKLKENKYELQIHKEDRNRNSKIIEDERLEREKLKNEVYDLKYKNRKLFNQYLSLLKHLEEVKDMLNTTEKSKKSLLKRPSNISSGSCETVRDVLWKAFLNGMDNLNVEDLSILHDAIMDRNTYICHQNDICGKRIMSLSHFECTVIKNNLSNA